jgi:hypothetical protein
MEAAGGADPKTGEITLYSENIPNNAFEFRGVVAHEVEHQRYNTVLKELSREAEAVRKLPANPSEIMSPDGFLKPPYDAQFPLFHGFNKISQQKLVETDGVSDYSFTYWNAWLRENGAAATAVHETLAEIARYDAQGIAERLLTIKDRPEWVKLYDFVNEHYDRLTGQHVANPLTPRVEAEKAKSKQEAT